MKRSLLVAVAACAVLVSACGSDSPGAVAPTTAPAATQEATTGASTEQADGTEASTEQAGTETSTSDEATTGSSAEGAGLDADSKVWFQEFCGGMVKALEFGSPDTSGMSKDEVIKTIVDSYRGIGDIAAKTRTRLAALPEPTFEGGAEMAATGIGRLKGLAEAYGAGADTIARGSFSTPDELKAAIATIEAEAKKVNEEFVAPKLSPEIEAGIASIKDCAALR